jgi:hypothetical protein
MGEAKNRTKRFLSEHPFCVFCGGHAQTTSIEHCPPRALFQNRQWPEGFEFPACDLCNQGSSKYDLIASLLARMDPFENKGDRDGKTRGLMLNLRQNDKDLFNRLFSKVNGDRVPITDEMHTAVGTLAKKLTKAIYFKQSKLIFPTDGNIFMNWFTNEILLESRRIPIFDALQGITGSVPLLQRNGKYLNDQFQYKCSISENFEVMILQVLFGNALGFVTFRSL